MRNQFMTKMNAIAFTFFVGCCALTGCTDKDVYNPENGKTELKPESEYFDFATTDDVAFDVNYGKIAGGALLEVFTETPFLMTRTELILLTAKPDLKSLPTKTGVLMVK